MHADTKTQQDVLTSLPAAVGVGPATVLGTDATCGVCSCAPRPLGRKRRPGGGRGPRGPRPAPTRPSELGSEDVLLSRFPDAPSPALGPGVLGETSPVKPASQSSTLVSGSLFRPTSFCSAPARPLALSPPSPYLVTDSRTSPAEHWDLRLWFWRLRT